MEKPDPALSPVEIEGRWYVPLEHLQRAEKVAGMAGRAPEVRRLIGAALELREALRRVGPGAQHQWQFLTRQRIELPRVYMAMDELLAALDVADAAGATEVGEGQPG